MAKGLNEFQLKLIAILAMFLDHLAYIIPVNSISGSYGLLVLNAIGRITMPIMCFFIAEGYHHTKNLKRYFLRLFIFAAISQLPFYLFSIQSPPTSLWDFIRGNFHLNVIYTLFMGLLALTTAKSDKLNIFTKAILIFLTVLLTYTSDWRFYGSLWVLVFGLFRGNFKLQAILFAFFSVLRCANILISGNTVNAVIQLFTIFALPLIYLYDGKQGHKIKYGFYLFYPIHLLILGLIKIVV